MEEFSIFHSLLGSAGLYTYWALYILTGLACSYYVYQDVIKQTQRVLNIHPYWWVLFTLIGGVWTLLAYWIMQHSSIARVRGE